MSYTVDFSPGEREQADHREDSGPVGDLFLPVNSKAIVRVRFMSLVRPSQSPQQGSPNWGCEHQAMVPP